MTTGKKFKLGFLPTLFVLVAMLVTACGAGGGSGSTTSQPKAAPKADQIYKLGLVATDIATFDPAITTDTNSAAAIDTVFTGLVQLNDKLQLTPQLAQTYSVSPDGLTYTFILRPNLKFSDGTPLTASDVVYSIDRALSPPVADLNGVTQTYLGLIKDSALRLNGKLSTLIGDSLVAVNATTVKIVVSKKTAYFLEALSYPSSYIVEKSVIQKWGTKWTDHLSDNGGQGGDGPFKVLSYSHSTGIRLVPNTFYYGKAQTLQEVDLVFYKDVNTEYAAYQAGQLDLSSVPAADVPLLQANDKAELLDYPSLAIFYLTMNYLSKPFDNIDIRQAFSLAVNRDVIASAIYKNTVTPTCHIVPQGMPGYDPSLKCAGGAPTKGDVALAKQLLATGEQQEGYTPSTMPAITLTYPSGDQDTTNAITTIIQEWKSELGVTVTANVVDFNTLLTDVNDTVCATPNNLQKCLNKGLQMWYLGWIADYPDAQDWTTLQFDKGAPNNAWNWGQNLTSVAAQQQQVQTQLETADTDLGSNRLALYNQAEQTLVNQVAWLSLYQSNIVGALKKFVIGVVPNAQGLTPPNDWSNIYIANH
jgi:oligopeptide transport system substrate-binding protein